MTNEPPQRARREDAPTDPTDTADATFGRQRPANDATDVARAEQRDGAPVTEGDAPRPAPYGDPTPMAPGPSEQ